MRIHVAPDQVEKLLVVLRAAGRREVGGQLYGEQVAPSYFRINELTVQQQFGTQADFMVDIDAALRDADAYFGRTGHDYKRFNYVGEWHSHPSFAVSPSNEDTTTMTELVRDASFKGTFAVLMIARLDRSTLQLGAWVYDATLGASSVILEVGHTKRWP